MKRASHEYNFQGTDTKYLVNLVEIDIFSGCEFHEYASDNNQTNNNIYE